MPATVTRRMTKSGPRFIVRYRIGGRRAPLVHAGVFRLQSEAERWKERINTAIAAGELTPSLRFLEPRRGPDKRPRLVYFARLGELVKIGVSVEPVVRCRSLNAELLATEPGGRPRERELHEQFALSRTTGEWFRPSRALLFYIASLEEAAA